MAAESADLALPKSTKSSSVLGSPRPASPRLTEGVTGGLATIVFASTRWIFLPCTTPAETGWRRGRERGTLSAVARFEGPFVPNNRQFPSFTTAGVGKYDSPMAKVSQITDKIAEDRTRVRFTTRFTTRSPGDKLQPLSSRMFQACNPCESGVVPRCNPRSKMQPLSPES